MRLVTLAALVLVTMLSNSASDIPLPLLCLLSTLPAVVVALLLLLLVALRAGMAGMVDACDGMEARVDVDADAATAPLV